MFVVCIGGAAYLQFGRTPHPRPAQSAPQSANTLPILSTVQDFALTERDGRPITRKTLLGHVWIADFFFASCAGTCPVMSKRLQWLGDELQRQHMDEVICVSVSVDPTRDTPQVLQKYAAKHQASPTRWLFLTGNLPQIEDLAVKSFKLGAPEALPGEQILHSTHFFLIDRKGCIRGSYTALTDEEEEDLMHVPADRALPDCEKRRLLADVQALLREHS